MTKVSPFKAIDNQSIKYPECLEYLKGCNESELLEAVDSALEYVDRAHRYSMSRLYSLWNFIFERNETPQSCSSCLIRKSQDLKKWREKQTDANRNVLGDSVNLENKARQEPTKTTRGKRMEA